MIAGICRLTPSGKYRSVASFMPSRIGTRTLTSTRDFVTRRQCRGSRHRRRKDEER